MNCQEIREQLDSALDNQVGVSAQAGVDRNAELVAHVESCADCRVLYEEHLLIESALAVWTPRRPEVDLSDRVIEAARQEDLISSSGSVVGSKVATVDPRVARVSSDDKPVVRAASDTSPTNHNIWPTVVTVALVLVAVAIVFREKPSNIAKNGDTPEQSVPDGSPELFAKPQEQVADISHLVADAQSAWQGITSRVSHQTSGFSVFVPDLKNELGIADVMGSSDESSDSATPDNNSDQPATTKPSAVDKAFEFLFDKAEPAGTRTI